VAGMVKNERHQTAQLIYGEELAEIPLHPRSQAFYLVQRIQEEVHRFAIQFHRNVRSKNSFSSMLDEIEGVGPKTRTKVLRNFKSLNRLKEADIKEITDLGIHPRTAADIDYALSADIVST